MINNVSRYQGNNTLARPLNGAVSRSGAQLLLQTAATLSLAGPRRAASGGRSRRRMSAHANVSTRLPVSGLRQKSHESRRSGVRIREPGGGTQPMDARVPDQESTAAQTSRKKGKGAARSLSTSGWSYRIDGRCHGQQTSPEAV